jgi:TRAP-type uncharacterized transport system substrate-binding protein
MAHIITVTIPGGMYNGPDEDTPMDINADNIETIEDDTDEDNLNNSIITMKGGKIILAKETREQVQNIVNR